MRDAPAPPNAMLALGTSVVLDDVALRVSAFTSESESATVKLIGDVSTPDVAPILANPLIVGACAALVSVPPNVYDPTQP